VLLVTAAAHDGVKKLLLPALRCTSHGMVAFCCCCCCCWLCADCVDVVVLCRSYGSWLRLASLETTC
jgi:hypothetical protein